MIWFYVINLVNIFHARVSLVLKSSLKTGYTVSVFIYSKICIALLLHVLDWLCIVKLILKCSTCEIIFSGQSDKNHGAILQTKCHRRDLCIFSDQILHVQNAANHSSKSCPMNSSNAMKIVGRSSLALQDQRYYNLVSNFEDKARKNCRRAGKFTAEVIHIKYNLLGLSSNYPVVSQDGSLAFGVIFHL